jgi:hypothetical protein
MTESPRATPDPCPFCGGEPEVLNERSVHCNNPGCEAQPFTAGQTKAEAIAAWNRRATPDQGSAELSEPAAWLCCGSLFHSYDAIPFALLPPNGSPVPLFATATQPAPSVDELRQQIMNLPCKPYDGTDAYTHYCRGHRDARHAAADLVAAAATQGAPTPAQPERRIVADLPGMARYGALQAVLDALEDSDIPAAAAIVKNLLATGIHPTPPQAQGSEENRAGAVRACRYTNKPGGACWRKGKAVELCTCHGMTDEQVDAVVAKNRPLTDAGKTGESAASSEPVFEERLLAVLEIVNSYLPPGCIDAATAMRGIVGLVDPWPASSAMGNWINCSDRLPPTLPARDRSEFVLVACEFDRPGDWRIKMGQHYHHEGWKLFGASWTPSHWMPLPAPPGAASPSPSNERENPTIKCPPRGVMFDAFGRPRVRYVRVSHDGTTCVVPPGDVAAMVDSERPDDYRTEDVYLSKEEFDALPEFDGF